jgi:hypothetical protein
MRALHQGAGAGAVAEVEVQGETGGLCAFYSLALYSQVAFLYKLIVSAFCFMQQIIGTICFKVKVKVKVKVKI